MPDPTGERRDKRVETVDVDVAIVGAGPAGIAAAVRAAEARRRVLVLDEGLRVGGQIWRHRARAGLTGGARRWLERFDRCGARFIGRATVFDAAAYAEPAPEGPSIWLAVELGPPGSDPGRELGAAGGLPVHARALVVRAAAVVLATGARERFLPFPGWTLPGVIGVGGVQALLKSGLSVERKRVIVAGSGPLLLPVASSLAGAGAAVVLVAEQAPLLRVASFGAGLWRTPGRLAQAAHYRRSFRRAPYHTGTWVVRADADDGQLAVALATGDRTRTEMCDLLCVGFGLVPSTELARLLGCAIRGGAVAVDDRQATSVPGVWCAGEPTGIGGVDAAAVQGEIAGLASAAAPVPLRLRRERHRQQRFARRLGSAFALRDELRSLPDDATLVCRCEDVPFARLRVETGVRSAKLHTRAGMGACQGRVCGAALDFLLDWGPDKVRSPVLPASVAALFGAGAAGHELDSGDV